MITIFSWKRLKRHHRLGFYFSDRSNIDRNQTRDRVNNNRDVNINRDRTVNVDRNRTVNVDRNRHVVVNPRGGAAWGWNRGVAWVPRTNYWGGGFWGPFAVGAAAVGMTSAIVNRPVRKIET